MSDPFILYLGRCVECILTRDRISNTSTKRHVSAIRFHLARHLLKLRTDHPSDRGSRPTLN